MHAISLQTDGLTSHSYKTVGIFVSSSQPCDTTEWVCEKKGIWETRGNNEDHFIEFKQADKNALIYSRPAWGQHSLETLENVTPGKWAINHYPIAKMMAARFFP